MAGDYTIITYICLRTSDWCVFKRLISAIYGMPLPKPLAKQEFKLLQYLSECEGSVCEKEKIFDHLWQEEKDHTNAEDRLTALVKRLRQKIENKDSHRYVENVRGRGYKFVQSATDIERK